MTVSSTYITQLTATTAGAVATLQLVGPDAKQMLMQLTERDHWPIGHAMLCDFAGIDKGLATLINEQNAQLMPHGGTLIVSHILEKLVEAGAVIQQPENLAPAHAIYPEAANELEAQILLAMSQAASPRAIELLLEQPVRWADLLQKPIDEINWQAITDTSRVLDQLIHPPSVVVMGQPNVGKSTLANCFTGKATSIVADLPGTTRDWVANLIEIDGIAMRWFDTPGLRDSDDEVEQHAIELARDLIDHAAVLIVMRDPATDWPTLENIHHAADIRVMNKADLLPDAANDAERDGVIHISAEKGIGLAELGQAIIGKLNLLDEKAETPWAFCSQLNQAVKDRDLPTIRDMLEPAYSRRLRRSF